jgi:uncharacterized protein (TIGR03663 family)
VEQPVVNKPLRDLVKLDWMKAVYILFIVLALVTRLWALGDRVQSHDESIHAKYSWNLYAGYGFQHHPLMHGPSLFHITALSYFIFGDNDFTARLPVALIGVVMVAFPYLLRRWLGRAGALATSFFLLISPSIAYYSRYIRHDIPLAFLSLVVVLAIFRYLHDGHERRLYLLAAGASLMFATFEAAFIYNAIFGLFLVGLFSVQATLRAWVRENLKSFFWIALVAVGVGLLILGLGVASEAGSQVLSWWAISGGILALLGLLIATVLLTIGNLRREDYTPPSLVLVLLIVAIGVGVVIRLGLPLTLVLSDAATTQGLRAYDFLTRVGMTLKLAAEYALPTRVSTVLIGLPIASAVLIGFAWLLATAFRSNRAFDLVIVLGTLCLPFLSPALIKWAAGLDPMDYQAPTLYYSFAILIQVLVLSVAVGLMWGQQRRSAQEGSNTWLIAAGIHYAIFLVFFTTFFTNGYGIASGLVGSLGYWLEQQAVERGGQPWYYYIITVLFYEFLPLLLTAIAALYLAIRGARLLLPRTAAQQQAHEPAGNSPDHASFAIRHSLFIPFLLWWIAASWLAYSYAGEKMPWLTTHITLPMILLSGWLVGQLIERTDWRQVLRRRAWLLALVAPPLVMAAAVLFNAAAAGPLSGRTLTQLYTIGRLANGLLGVLLLGTVAGYLVWRIGWRLAARVLLLVALLLPVGLTIRTTERFCYVTDEYPTEFLVYAHAAPGLGEAMRQIEELSRRLTGSPYDIKVAYGEDGSTLFYWQFRNFPNAVFFGSQPSGEQMDAPVIVAGRDQWNAVTPYVGDTYIYNEYTYLWWPMQDYMGLTWPRITRAITDTQLRTALWEIWYDRDYRLYDQVTGETHTLDQWPLRSDFRLYIRRDVAARMWELSLTEPGEELAVVEAPEETGPIDPYATGWQDLAARQVFGSPGTAPGQLQSPRGIKIGPDGFVYVADAGNHRIQEFTADGQFVAAWGRLSTLETETGTPQGFFEPWDVAVAPDGSLYVADTWNHRIQRLDAEGNVLAFWGLFGQYGIESAVGRGAFYGPRGIAVDSNGNVYVADTGNKRIQVFTPDGQFIRQWGGGGALEGYLDEPVGIAIGPGDEVYVADTWNRRVQVFDTTGNFLRQWPIAGWDTGNPEEKPYLAVDSQGYVYVTDPGHYRVLVFDRLGNYLLSFGKQGADERSFALPTGIAAADDGTVYATDAHGGRVLVFDLADALAGNRASEVVVVPQLLSPAAGLPAQAGDVVLAGSGESFSLVHILIDGESIGAAQTNSDGDWSFTAHLDEPGEHEIALQVLDDRGGILVASDPVTLTVISAPPAPGVTLTLDFPAEGGQLPSGGVTLSGSGEPSSTIEILYDGVVTGTALVGDDGRWAFTFVPAAGGHRFAVRATGALTPVAVVSATVATNACDSPAGTCTGDTYVVTPGDTFDCIVRCTGVSLRDLLAANPAIVDPDRIVRGQIIHTPR